MTMKRRWDYLIIALFFIFMAAVVAWTAFAMPIRYEKLGDITVRLEVAPFSLPVSMLGESAKVDSVKDNYMVIVYTGSTVTEAKGYSKFKQAETAFQQAVKKNHGKDVEAYQPGKTQWKNGKVTK